MSNKLVEACTILSKYLLTNEFHIVHCICICIRIFDTFKKTYLAKFWRLAFWSSFWSFVSVSWYSRIKVQGKLPNRFWPVFSVTSFYGFDLLIVFYSFNAFIARRSKRNSYFLLKQGNNNKKNENENNATMKWFTSQDFSKTDFTNRSKPRTIRWWSLLLLLKK